MGIGHLVRGARIATALAAGSFDVTVVVGGDLSAGLDFGAASIQRLPPVKAGPAGFGDLVGLDGQKFGPAERDRRRDLLVALFRSLEPDVLLIEAFPFGRRQMRFELLPLLEAAKAKPHPPLIAASVRDILQENRKAGRDAETVALVREFFDLVLVHGDPALAGLAASFPLASEIADRIVHTGLVGTAVKGEPAPAERFDVVVSVGGGAVGAALVETALLARALSRLAEASWLVLTGPNLPAGSIPEVPPGVSLRTFEPGLPALLRVATLSISQAGYNTVADLLSAPNCRMILVPHAAGGETEQSHRAALLAARGWAVVLPEQDLAPGALAQAIDHALDLPKRIHTFAFDGAARTCDILERAHRRAGRPVSETPP